MKLTVKMVSREFVPQIRRGTKRSTIRPERKVPHQIGDVLDLRCWEGRPYWSKQKHVAYAEVIAYHPITIHREGFEIDGVFTPRPQDLERLAKLDGFRSWSALVAWFSKRYDLPFRGFFTEWREPVVEVRVRNYGRMPARTRKAVGKVVRLTMAAVLRGDL